MIYNLDNDAHRKQFKEKIAFFWNNRKQVELKQKSKARTIRQNKYLHLILSWYGLETGYSLQEVKDEIFKREICKDLFRYEKGGKVFFRSTAALDTKEMTIAIDVFRDHASKFHGIYLPEPHEQEELRSLEEQLSRYGNRQYV